MANSDAPFGFRPSRSPAGSAYANPYKALNAVRILEGDLVELAADGFIDLATTANGPFLGAAQASDPSSVSSSTERTLLIYDDPNQEYECQADSATIAQTHVGERFLAQLDTGNTLISQHQVDVVAATSAAQPLLVTALSPAVGNEAGAFQKVIVRIMNHVKSDV